MTARASLLVLVPVLAAVACIGGDGTTTTAGGKMSGAMAAPDTAAVRQAIEAANVRFVDAVNRGDTAMMVANYADDAVVMMSGEPAWRGGKDVLLKGFTAMMAQATVKDMAFHTDNVMVGGDLAVETGSFAWTVTPKGGKPMPDKGKYVTVWRKQADGSWKIIRDINNTDLPPAKM
jgi:uncharacterized protein (TIGR02246 family)